VRLEQLRPSVSEVSTSSSINQREAGEAGAAAPSVVEVSTSSSIDQREAGEAGAVEPSAAEVSTSSSIDSGKLVRLEQPSQAV
jgi:hypothetical protein